MGRHSYDHPFADASPEITHPKAQLLAAVEKIAFEREEGDPRITMVGDFIVIAEVVIGDDAGDNPMQEPGLMVVTRDSTGCVAAFDLVRMAGVRLLDHLREVDHSVDEHKGGL